MARSSQAGGDRAARAAKRGPSRAHTAARRAKADRPAEAAKPARALRRAATQSKAGAAGAASGAADRSLRPATGRGDPAPGPDVTASAPRAPAAGPVRAGAPRAAKAPAAPEAAERASTAGRSTPDAAGNSGGAAQHESMLWRAPATGQASELGAMLRASESLIAGSIRVRIQLIEFSCRQAEHGFAFGRALLAGGSLPKVWALQAQYLGRVVDDALAHALEFSRLSTDVFRAGLGSLRPR
jgi:hypothetical protein